MQNFEKLQFAVGIFWVCMGLYIAIGLIPGIGRRLQEWESRLKGRKIIIWISPLRRIVLILMCGFCAAILFTGAFHRNLAEIMGIKSETFILILIFLPSLSVLLGIRDKHVMRRRG
jgi:hypothetical protein